MNICICEISFEIYHDLSIKGKRCDENCTSNKLTILGKRVKSLHLPLYHYTILNTRLKEDPYLTMGRINGLMRKNY